jgi:acetylornithine deacetylase
MKGELDRAIGAHGEAAVCYGATGHDFHGIDESVELQSIIDAARTLARFIHTRFTAPEHSR